MACCINWGSDWRMPTKEEVEELIEQCTRVETVDAIHSLAIGYLRRNQFRRNLPNHIHGIIEIR